jgi:hypothetical protein
MLDRLETRVGRLIDAGWSGVGLCPSDPADVVDELDQVM